MNKESKGGYNTLDEVGKRSSSDVERRRHPPGISRSRVQPPNRNKDRSKVSNDRRTVEKSRKTKSTNDLRKGRRDSTTEPAYVGMFKAKILVIGPRECGKTVISNHLADATEISGGDYHPTQGVRILEFESSGILLGGKKVSCEVELWDCSGDQKFENCWPAIQKDANGVLFVCNPDKVNHGKELEMLYVHFVQEQGLRDSQCMLFAHHRPGTNEKTRFQARLAYSTNSKIHQIPQLTMSVDYMFVEVDRPASYLSKIPCVETNLEEDPDMVKQKFNNLLAVLIRNWTENRDQEELSIMNH